MYAEKLSSISPQHSLPLEVKLIALLILLRGATDIPSYLIKLYNIWFYNGSSYSQGKTGFIEFLLGIGNHSLHNSHLFFGYQLPILLGIAGIIIGIGLLLRALWAFWSGIILLSLTSLCYLIDGIILRLPFLFGSSSPLSLASFAGMSIFALAKIAALVTMIYFLTSWKPATVAREDPPGLPPRVNLGSGQQVSVTTPRTALFIGLLLLCWAAGAILPLFFFPSFILRDFRMLTSESSEFQVYALSGLSIAAVFGIGYLLSGIGLLRNARWASILAIVVLSATLFCPNLWIIIQSFIHQDALNMFEGSRYFSRNSVLVDIILKMFKDLLINGTLIYFLLKVREGKSGKSIQPSSSPTI